MLNKLKNSTIAIYINVLVYCTVCMKSSQHTQKNVGNFPFVVLKTLTEFLETHLRTNCVPTLFLAKDKIHCAAFKYFLIRADFKRTIP